MGLIITYMYYNDVCESVILLAVMDIEKHELCADINFTINLRHSANHLFTFTYI